MFGNCRRFFVSPLQGYIYNNADSHGVALCYNISPLQGFKNAPLRGDGMEVPAFAGMTGKAGMTGAAGMTGFFAGMTRRGRFCCYGRL
ncbi:MAG: hypothetical protein ACR2P4_07990 [Gammaproteobacteria bacterium]